MATKTGDIITIAESLPDDIKAKLIEKLLNSLHPTQKEIDALWAKEAERRVAEIKIGKVKSISGNEVFGEIRARFAK
jgi:putative addiction module component (TIGR02574 family)